MGRPNRTRLNNNALQSTYIDDAKKKVIDQKAALDTSLADALNLAKKVLIADPSIKSNPLGKYSGNFHGFELYNEDNNPVYIHFHDVATKGAVAAANFVKTIKVPAQGAWAFLYDDTALFHFEKGLVAFATSDQAGLVEVNAQVFGTFYYWDNN